MYQIKKYFFKYLGISIYVTESIRHTRFLYGNMIVMTTTFTNLFQQQKCVMLLILKKKIS